MTVRFPRNDGRQLAMTMCFSRNVGTQPRIDGLLAMSEKSLLIKKVQADISDYFLNLLMQKIN